jgi:predicted nucleotidyltransferase
MPMTEIQRNELRHCLQAKPTRVLFATACGPLLYGFPQAGHYFDLRSVHVEAGDGASHRMGLQETREWRETRPECQVEWVSHELGKFVRLLQVNNGSAYEQLFSPHVVFETAALGELKELASEMVSLQLFLHYRSFYQSQLKFFHNQRDKHSRHLLYLFRVALTGIHLLETGQVVADLRSLAGYHERVAIMELLRDVEQHPEGRSLRPYLRELEALALRLDQMPNRARLREQVSGRDAADAWLAKVRTEMAAGPV